MLTTLLALVATLALLIAVHEYGHYLAARWCGVRVLRFSIGFGRVLLRHQHRPDSTEFTLSALPFGGYVRMLDSREGWVAPEQLSQAFDHQPLRARVLIVSAGPVANLLLAVLLYACVSWWGSEEPRAVLSTPHAGSLLAQADGRSGDWVRAWARSEGDWQPVHSMVDLRWAMTQALMDNASVRLEVTDRDGRHRRELLLATHEAGSTEINEATWRKLGLAAPFSEPIMGDIRPEGAALKAGLQVGDRVLVVDGTPVADAASLRERVRGLPATGQSQMDWLVMRGDQRLTFRIEPRVLRDGGQSIGRIDAVVGRPPEMLTVQLGGWEGLVSGLRRTQDTAWLTLRMIGRMVTGDASIKNLSGPLSIAEGAGQSARLGLSYFLGFLALISVSLGVLNLLPLPMLDGGHLIYYLFEGVTGRPVPERWLARFQRGGVALLLLITFVALFNDVARLLGSA